MTTAGSVAGRIDLVGCLAGVVVASDGLVEPALAEEAPWADDVGDDVDRDRLGHAPHLGRGAVSGKGQARYVINSRSC